MIALPEREVLAEASGKLRNMGGAHKIKAHATEAHTMFSGGNSSPRSGWEYNAPLFPPALLSMALIPIILSGGAGTRLWPLSREAAPKPFMPLSGSSGD